MAASEDKYGIARYNKGSFTQVLLQQILVKVSLCLYRNLGEYTVSPSYRKSHQITTHRACLQVLPAVLTGHIIEYIFGLTYVIFGAVCGAPAGHEFVAADAAAKEVKAYISN
jgi:hypothetical protein